MWEITAVRYELVEAVLDLVSENAVGAYTTPDIAASYFRLQKAKESCEK